MGLMIEKRQTEDGEVTAVKVEFWVTEGEDKYGMLEVLANDDGDLLLTQDGECVQIRAVNYERFMQAMKIVKTEMDW